MSKKRKKVNTNPTPANTEKAQTQPASDEQAASSGSYGELIIGFLKWFIIAVVIGMLVGVVGASFHHCLDFATETRTEYPYIIFGLPLAGLLIVFLYKLAGLENDPGTNGVISEAKGENAISFKLAVMIFSATFLTHFFGGSAGREGAALQIGAGVASPFKKLLKLDKLDSSVLIMCGMAAGFSSLFGTPAAAAVFAMEVAIVGSVQYSAIVPCVVSSVTASLTASLMGVSPTSFGEVTAPVFGTAAGSVIAKVCVLALLCALVSILFCQAMHLAADLYKKYIKNPYLRVIAGALIVIGLTFLVGTYDYNGAGGHVIERAIGGEAAPEAFLLKILFTALTLGAGFKGGEIVPSFFVGSTFGCFAGSLLGLDPSFSAAVGLLSVFCGVTNCPMATAFLSAELFGSEGLVFFIIAIAISFMCSGYESLYRKQDFMYTKLKPQQYIRKENH